MLHWVPMDRGENRGEVDLRHDRRTDALEHIMLEKMEARGSPGEKTVNFGHDGRESLPKGRP